LPFKDHLASLGCFLLEATEYAVPETVDVEVEAVEAVECPQLSYLSLTREDIVDWWSVW
jgi:hypothetical protein